MEGKAHASPYSIAILARKRLVVRASSAAADRVFSVGGHIVTRTRKHLSGDRFPARELPSQLSEESRTAVLWNITIDSGNLQILQGTGRKGNMSFWHAYHRRWGCLLFLTTVYG